MHTRHDLFDLEHDPDFDRYHREFRRTEVAAGRDPDHPSDSDIQRFWDGFEQVVEKYVPAAAKRIVEDIRTPERMNEQARHQIQIAASVEGHWGAALHRYGEFTTAFEQFVARGNRRLLEAEEMAPWIYQSRAIIGARGIATAVEIEVLLRHGLVAGAWARWRTLYELAVIAKYIAKHGERIAEAYCFHQIPQRHELLKAMKARNPEDALALLVNAHEESVARLKTPEQFGSAFPTAYGWAAREGWYKKPRFDQLVDDVEMRSAHPEYLQANRAVHGGPGGYLDFLSAERAGQRPWQGARWLGQPLRTTAKMLTDLAGSLISNPPPPRDCAFLQALIQLRDELVSDVEEADARFPAEPQE
jgi:hypothetical protein